MFLISSLAIWLMLTHTNAEKEKDAYDYMKHQLDTNIQHPVSKEQLNIGEKITILNMKDDSLICPFGQRVGHGVCSEYMMIRRRSMLESLLREKFKEFNVSIDILDSMSESERSTRIDIQQSP